MLIYLKHACGAGVLHDVVLTPDVRRLQTRAKTLSLRPY